MTLTDYEAARLFVTAEEEDAENVVTAPGMPEEDPPFDGHLKPLPPDDDILAALALAERVQARASELRRDLQAQLTEERRKAGVGT